MQTLASKANSLADECVSHYLASGMNPGDEVRALRKARNLTQPELAVRSGISPRRLSDIENGANTSLDMLELIAKGLEVPLVRLFGQLSESDIPEECRALVTALIGLSPDEKRRFAVVAEAFAAALRDLSAVQYGSERNSRNPDARNDGSLTQRNVSSSIHPTLPTEDTPRRRTVHIEAPNVREPGAITKKPKQRGLDQGDDPVRR
jgi:transcriptional regulator with XRE-family HTH domain